MDLGEHKSTVFSASFSNDSSLVATTSKDGTLKLWKVDGKEFESWCGHVFFM